MSGDGSDPKKPKIAKAGYKNPPKHTQFKKGQSGNPLGRIKIKQDKVKLGDPDYAFAEVLAEPIPITMGGQKTSMPRYKAILTKLANKAISGDGTAMKLCVEWLLRLPSEYKDPQAQFIRFTEADQKMIEEMRRQAASFIEEDYRLEYERSLKNEKHEPTENEPSNPASASTLLKRKDGDEN